MTSDEIRARYLKFFERLGHVRIEPSPLVLENDPTTLFTSSGMQQLVPYLKGEPHPKGKKLVDSQPSLRLQDIEEVGDNRHTTFFEMLGNWSLGDYFKAEQLPWCWEFFTKGLGLDPDKLYVSVFEGTKDVPKDSESAEIWKKIGVPEDHIYYYGVDKNWWSRSGTPEDMPKGEIGGPDSEVFYDFGTPHDSKYGAECHPNCQCGRFMEIGNSVFIQYIKNEDGSLTELPQKNVDFGGGLERIVAAVNGTADIFEIDFFKGIIGTIEKEIFKKFNYSDRNVQTSFRILADHMRAAAFILAGGIYPSNKGHGYVLRRLLRRATMQKYKWGLRNSPMSSLIDVVMDVYEKEYPFIRRASEMKRIVDEEDEKFMATINVGLKAWHKLLSSKSAGMEPIGTMKSGEGPKYGPILPEEVFKFITTYGLPLDIIRDELDWKGDYKKVEKLLEEHRELSKVTSAGMFKGGLADASEDVTKLHTVTHLLHASLRKVLGEHVSQKGSNITVERLRFDFSHPEKLSDEEIRKVEDLINEQVKKDLPVGFEEKSLDEAQKEGALAFFGEKYGQKVKVYTIGDPNGEWFSKEVCGGPHVSHTGEIGNVRIKKQEKVGSGVIRIYAGIS